MRKVNLILIDGMRPDAFMRCGNPYVQTLLDESVCTLEARTVFPPVTLPCHMSLFYSVQPERHGVKDNLFKPMAQPVNGIMEQIHGRRTTAMLYNWEQLRDISRPGNRDYSFFASSNTYGSEIAANMVIEASKKLLTGERAPDFCFTYIGWPDEQGHDDGWMSEEYIQAVNGSISLARDLIEATKEDYITILTADHGGHGRNHGELIDEDMLIPLFILGEGIKPGKIEEPVSILDIAPTVVRLLDCEPAEEWEGRSLI